MTRLASWHCGGLLLPAALGEDEWAGLPRCSRSPSAPMEAVPSRLLLWHHGWLLFGVGRKHTGAQMHLVVSLSDVRITNDELWEHKMVQPLLKTFWLFLKI